MHSRASTIIGGIGRLLIALGLIVLMFAGYQLWGTGLQEEAAQDKLDAEFAERQTALVQLGFDVDSEQSPTPSTTEASDDSNSPSTTAAPKPVSIAPAIAEELLTDRGEVLGEIRIPSIDVTKKIIEGVGRGDLRKGPGHYPKTPYPGQAGNAAIAGHRTTYGQPFHNLDKVSPGDIIEVDTLQGTFFYQVEGHANSDGIALGHFIVDPTQVDVVDDKGDNRLTLTACHPKYSARQRIVVTAVMVGEPAPLIPIPTPSASDEIEPTSADESAELVSFDEGNTVGIEEETLEESLGWHMEELNGVLWWCGLCLLIALAGWLLGRAWRRWPSYLLTTPVFLATLFITFGHVDRMLPAL